MAAKNNREVYRGRRRRLNVLGIVFGALAVLLLLLIVLFYGLQRYIVFEHDGIAVVLPGAQTDSASGDASQNEAYGLTQVNAALTVEEPDYSAVAATAGEGLDDMAAIYVPSADVSLDGVGKYLNVMGQYSGANALVLDVKPVSGQLAWASSSSVAASYSTNGTTNLSQLVASIKQQHPDIRLVAQLSCCIDGLLAQRCPAAALCLASGAAFIDSEGAWVDPYSDTVSTYLTELCTELIDMGFDEILLHGLTMPITDQALLYNVQLSSTPTPETAICGLAMELTNALDSYDVPVSVILDTMSLRDGLSSTSGQNLELFGKIFDRLCSATNSAWQSNIDLGSVDQYLTLGSTAQRYVPIMEYIPEGFSSCIIHVPDSVFPQEDTGTEQ